MLLEATPLAVCDNGDGSAFGIIFRTKADANIGVKVRVTLDFQRMYLVDPDIDIVGTRAHGGCLELAESFNPSRVDSSRALIPRADQQVRMRDR